MESRQLSIHGFLCCTSQSWENKTALCKLSFFPDQSGFVSSRNHLNTWKRNLIMCMLFCFAEQSYLLSYSTWAGMQLSKEVFSVSLKWGFLFKGWNQFLWKCFSFALSSGQAVGAFLFYWYSSKHSDVFLCLFKEKPSKWVEDTCKWTTYPIFSSFP